MRQASEKNGSGGDPGTRAICLLYAGFFVVWCIGLALGEIWTGPGQPTLMELPLWFLIGCVFSSIAVSVALVFCVRRYFR